MTLVEESTLKTALAAAAALAQANGKNNLLNEAEKIFAQVSLHKIPAFPNDKEIRKLVLLPNRLYPSGCSSCLIVKNLSEDDIESTIDETNELLKQQDITFIENVLPYEKLKKEYKGHEQKRKLAQQFDVFFADSRITRLVQSHLGKEFKRRRRVPVNIRMERTNKIKEEMENALRSTQVILTPKGANMNIWFATTEMSDEQKLQNLQSLIDGLGNVIPRGVANVKAIYLQGTGTKAVPIYRNASAGEEVNEQSGIELERWAAHKQKLEVLKDFGVKKVAPKKSKKEAKKSGKERKGTKAGKRKLLKAGQKAKRAKLEKTEDEVKTAESV